MKIYHFTDKDIKKVEVSYFGDNLHTFNDTKVSKIPRSFFYLTPEAKEYRFKNKKCYITEVNENDIYDLAEDKKRYARGFSNIDDLLTYLKKHYKGIIYKVGFKMCVLFDDIEVTEYKGV